MRAMINDVSALTRFLTVLDEVDGMLAECVKRTEKALQDAHTVWKDDKYAVFEASAKQYTAQLEAVRSELSSDCQTKIRETLRLLQDYINLKY